MRTRLLLLLAVIAGVLWVSVAPSPLALAAPVPKALKKQSDAEQLLGTWSAVSVEAEDADLRAAVQHAKFTFRKRTLTLRVGDDDAIDSGVYSLNDQAVLKSLTWDNDQGDPHTGLYELDGDTLRLCSVFEESDTPPTVFDAKERRAIITLKRVKQEK